MIDRSQSDRFLLDNSSTEKSGIDPRGVTTAQLEAAGHFPDKLTTIIRNHCTDCCAGQLSEVRHCTVTNCSLWPYRMGTNPFRKQNLSEEQREAKRLKMVEVSKKRKAAA